MSQTFAGRLIRWQLEHGRHGLPWQGTNDPYAIWVSEVMLQQTQVLTVIPYYQQFMRAFPDVSSLAEAPLERVLALWSGLGYYSRARHLHRSAQLLLEDYGGEFPHDRTVLQRLPGIGRSTAAAIAAFAFGECCTILDGNVKRILARYFGIHGYPGERAIEAQLWQMAERLLPQGPDSKTMASYTQALMDLGALVCVRARPRCQLCPLQSDCVAYRHDQTAVLPTPKPRKSLPVKAAAHLIVIDHNRIFLEKRPPSGIWGGLWCFPELAVDQDSIDYCARNINLSVSKITELPCLNHGFTHFKLCIYPQLLRLVMPGPSCAVSDRTWVTIEEARQLAIPAPVKKLLSMTETVFQSCNHVSQ